MQEGENEIKDLFYQYLFNTKIYILCLCKCIGSESDPDLTKLSWHSATCCADVAAIEEDTSRELSVSELLERANRDRSE